MAHSMHHAVPQRSAFSYDWYEAGEVPPVGDESFSSRPHFDSQQKTTRLKLP